MYTQQLSQPLITEVTEMLSMKPNSPAIQPRTFSVGRTQNVLDNIGNTPLVRLSNLSPNPLVDIYVKVEYMNPSGSIKDRIAKYMFEELEKSGKLTPGGTVVENSSGNTASSVAMVAAIKGYKAILVVPDKCSFEKQNTLKAFGAQLVVAPSKVHPDSPLHYENAAKRIAALIPGSVRLDQYNNPLNTEAHYRTTGPEIWNQTNGKIDYLVAGASTGGTVSGTGKYLKEKSEGRVKVVISDPLGSCLYNFKKTGSFQLGEQEKGKSTQIEGIGKNYRVDNMDFNVIDDAVKVTDREAFMTAQRLAREEGLLCGGSSGANVWSAMQIAKTCTKPTVIVAILPDGGVKYLTKIFNPVWLAEHGICLDDPKLEKPTNAEDYLNLLERDLQEESECCQKF